MLFLCLDGHFGAVLVLFWRCSSRMMKYCSLKENGYGFVCPVGAQALNFGIYVLKYGMVFIRGNCKVRFEI